MGLYYTIFAANIWAGVTVLKLIGNMQACSALNIIILNISLGCLNGSYAPEIKKQYRYTFLNGQ